MSKEDDLNPAALYLQHKKKELSKGARLLEILSYLGERHILCVSVIEQWLLLLVHLMGVSKIIQFAVAESDVKRVAIKVQPLSFAPPPLASPRLLFPLIDTPPPSPLSH